MLKKLNPFRGLENPREVWAWGMYDLANQSFTLLINTLLFAVYFRDVVVGPEGPGDALWGATVGVSLLLVVVASPFMGAVADHLAIKKPMLMVLALVCIAFTCALGLIPPGAVVLAIAIYVPANIAFAIGENFLAAFLPEIAGTKDLGRVSAIGWTMGYVGALMLLGLMAAGMWLFDLGLPSQWRPFFVFAGLWFLLASVPTALFLRERAEPEVTQAGQAFRLVLRDGVARVIETARHATRYAQLIRFLLVFFVYSMGVQSVIFFAAIIANGFGFEGARLAVFLLPVTIAAGIGAVVTHPLQKRLGYRTTIHVYLVIWAFTAVSLVAFNLYQGNDPTKGRSLLWIVGVAMGLALGGIGASSRAIVGVLTPMHKTAEFFGLWGLSYKLAGFVGVVLFGLIKSYNETLSYALLAGVFVLGVLWLFTVDEKGGMLAAREAEAVHRDEVDGRDLAAQAHATGPTGSSEPGTGPTPAGPDESKP